MKLSRIHFKIRLEIQAPRQILQDAIPSDDLQNPQQKYKKIEICTKISKASFKTFQNFCKQLWKLRSVNYE